jgi:hypothetical protein
MTMPVITQQEILEIGMRPGTRCRFSASAEPGARGVCLLVNTADPGAAAPLHKHTAGETLLVLEGTVRVRVGDESHSVNSRPAGTRHILAGAHGGPTHAAGGGSGFLSGGNPSGLNPAVRSVLHADLPG